MADPDRYRDHGLLALRVGLGAMFVMHGWPKLAGGAGHWTRLGKQMKYVGIDFAPEIWGFAAGISELGGGILLMLGLLFRPACVALFGTMVVAAMSHLGKGQSLVQASHAIEDGIVFFALFFIGPGAHSIDARRN
ncbi:MAG: DoxX family protein [Myxococcota bacterium]